MSDGKTILRGIDPPADGLYENVPADTYDQWRAWRSTLVKKFGDSPLHAAEEIANPTVQTTAMKLGTACHLAVLQPELFLQQYTVATGCTETTKAGKRCSKGGSVVRAGNWYCGQHDPAPTQPFDNSCVLDIDEYATCMRVRESVMSHPLAGEILRAEGPVERSGVFRDEATGLRLKFRTDKVLKIGEFLTVADLKTTEDANPNQYQHALERYGYHISAAMYLKGLAVVGQPCERFVHIAVEKSPPYAVAVYRVMDDALEAGNYKLTELLSLVSQCERTGVFPGYGFHFTSNRYQFQEINLTRAALSRV